MAGGSHGMCGCQTEIELCDMRQLCLTSPDKCARHGSMLILEALPSFERRAKASCLASPGLQSVELVWYEETGPSSILSLMCLSGTTCQVGTPHRVTEGKAPPTDRSTPDCTSTSQLPVRPSLSYLNKELAARAANFPAPR
jgi:hypothetical protein